MKKRHIVDLSRRLIPGKERFRLDIKTFFVEEYIPGYIEREEDDWYIMQDVTLCSHVGTHIESPYHHVKEGKDSSEIPLDSVIGEAVVLDFTHKKADEPVTLEEIKKAGRMIKEGDIVLIKVGWSKYYNTEMYKHRPYLTIEAAKWLMEKKIKCIGSDSSGIENIPDIGQPMHRLIFENNVPIIEDMENLEALTQNRVFLIALPWKVKGLDASPTRVIAIEERDG